jgi:hypothetical protein
MSIHIVRSSNRTKSASELEIGAAAAASRTAACHHIR